MNTVILALLSYLGPKLLTMLIGQLLAPRLGSAPQSPGTPAPAVSNATTPSA